MKMYIGGAFQGKLAYATKQENISEWVDGSSCREDDLYKCKGVFSFHEFIKERLKLGDDLSELPNKLYENNKDIVIISDEIGYGIVPMDPFERKYREQVGRICTGLAEKSDEVYRIVCGIGKEIKNG